MFVSQLQLWDSIDSLKTSETWEEKYTLFHPSNAWNECFFSSCTSVICVIKSLFSSSASLLNKFLLASLLSSCPALSGALEAERGEKGAAYIRCRRQRQGRPDASLFNNTIVELLLLFNPSVHFGFCFLSPSKDSDFITGTDAPF